MAFINNMSPECPKGQLDLFALPETQLSIEGCEVLHCSPCSSIENYAPIEFLVPESEDHYLDVANTYLVVVARVYGPGKADLAPDDTLIPVNNFLHSLFSDITTYVNGKLISVPSQKYGFRAYIESLFNYNRTAKETHLTCALYVKDTAGQMSSLSGNLGGIVRRKYIAGSKPFALMGKLSNEIFGQSKYMINNVPLKIVLSRAKPNFCLIGKEDSAYEIEIIKTELQIPRMKINPSVLIAHNKALDITAAKYPIPRVEIKSFTLSAGIMSFEQRLISGQEPVRVILGLVRNDSSHKYQLNPFDFGHFNMNFLSLTKNGIPVSTRPLQPDFATDKPNYIESFMNTFIAVGIGSKDDGYHVSRDEYGAGGYVLHCFDLTPDRSAGVHQWNLRRNSLIEISLRFAQALTDTLSLVVYAEYQNLMEIDKDRRVTVDY